MFSQKIISQRSWWLMLVFPVFVLYMDFVVCSKYDRENWVNPDDMLKYDRASKTMIAEKARKESQTNENMNSNICRQSDEHSNELKEKLAHCELTLNTMEKCQSVKISQAETEPKEANHHGQGRTCENKVTTDHQYMKRFVNILLQASGLDDFTLGIGETKQSSISIDVNGDHLTILQQFATSSASVSLNELDDVLSHVLHSSESKFLVPLRWLERLSHVFSSVGELYRVLPYGITLLLLAMMALRRSFWRIFLTFSVLVLALSYQWTYDYMLKMAEIKQYVTMKQYDDVPSSCRPSASWSGIFKYWFMHDAEECNKYYVAQMMDPALEVTPTIVFSELLSSMLLHPAGKLGESIAKFSGGILGGLPMFQNWLVLLLTYVFLAATMVVVAVLLCAGRLRLPYYLGGMEISGQSPRNILGHQRVAIQEIHPVPPSTANTTAPVINTTAPTNPLVSARSIDRSVILREMPALRKLMWAREERLVRQELSLDPSVDIRGTMLGCAQCKAEIAGSMSEWGKDISEGGEQNTKRRIASDNLRESGVEKSRDPKAEGDSSRNVTSNEHGDILPQKYSKTYECVNLASGDSGNILGTLNTATTQKCFLDETCTVESLKDIPVGNNLEVVPKRMAVLSSDNSMGVDLGAMDQMEKFTFINEIRMLLEEDDSENLEIGDNSMTENGRGEVEATEMRPEGRPYLTDTIENLLQECSTEAAAQETGPTSRTGAVPRESDTELIRKASSDSSDGSGDFVKL